MCDPKPLIFILARYQQAICTWPASFDFSSQTGL
jgi:hypothetical protein